MCYIERDGKYLMLYRNKKKNDMNEGKYLGIGGHVEETDASLDDAIKREVKEETNLDLIDLTYHGHVSFINKNEKSAYQEEMYVYTSNDFKGEIINCNEGTLEWVNKEDIYKLPLWEGDKYFLDLLIKNELDFELVLNYYNDKFIDCKRIK